VQYGGVAQRHVAGAGHDEAASHVNQKGGVKVLDNRLFHRDNAKDDSLSESGCQVTSSGVSLAHDMSG
jgi:hypothetical protein